MATTALREIECTPITYSGCFHHSRLFVSFLRLGRIGSIGIGELLRGRGRTSRRVKSRQKRGFEKAIINVIPISVHIS
jgi:hypothetical protein